MSKTALVIMAAGIGSRYGHGIKQCDAFGPSGEIMMEYSIHDALAAGFDKVVFIIRPDMDADFRKLIGDKISGVTEVAYAYQDIADLPAGFAVPEGRKKPWGTGQALLAAADVVSEPFCVINADDYYGKKCYQLVHDALVNETNGRGGKEQICMAGFVLGNTLSDNGGVTRGVCSCDADGRLIGIDETKNIIRTDTAEGAGVMTDNGIVPLDKNNLVSMNMWGLQPSFFDVLKKGFPEFLGSLGDDAKTKEYLLPTIIDGLLKAGKADVEVLKTDDIWFGVTYQEDRQSVKDALAKLIREGAYKTPLF